MKEVVLLFNWSQSFANGFIIDISEHSIQLAVFPSNSIVAYMDTKVITPYWTSRITPSMGSLAFSRLTAAKLIARFGRSSRGEYLLERTWSVFAPGVFFRSVGARITSIRSGLPFLRLYGREMFCVSYAQGQLRRVSSHFKASGLSESYYLLSNEMDLLISIINSEKSGINMTLGRLKFSVRKSK